MDGDTVVFRARGPSPVGRWHAGEYTGEGSPHGRFAWAIRIVTAAAMTAVFGAPCVVTLAELTLGLGVHEGLLMLLYLLLVVVVAAGVFVFSRVARLLGRRTVTATPGGLSCGEDIPWSDVVRVHAQLVEWRKEGGESGGYERHFEHAVLVERERDRLGFFVPSAQRAEALAEQLEGLRSQAASLQTSSRESVDHRREHLAARAATER